VWCYALALGREVEAGGLQVQGLPQWLMPIVLAAWKAEIGKIMV
jgi:hypothetical protein